MKRLLFRTNSWDIFRIFAVFVLWALAIPASAKAPLLTAPELSNPPPRIIRTCCSFGVDLSFAVMPLIKRTDITSIDDIGKHNYLGNKNEGNGIVYTQRGGFIDLGHVRDCADWTAYLYQLIKSKQGNEVPVLVNLKTEGGSKTLILDIPLGMDEQEAYQLAGKIAYDLSLWHEIATWFGASYIPLVPERYSSFSPEDLYSNLLGVNLGIRALQSDLEYNEAMTQMIGMMLDSLEAVSTIDDTYLAMEMIENVWWTREKSLPNKKILIERYVDSESCLIPWLVPDSENLVTPYELKIPDNYLSNLYQLRIKLNYKFPLKSIFPTHVDRTITQEDFGIFMNYIRKDIADLHLKIACREQRQQKRKDKKERRLQSYSKDA